MRLTPVFLLVVALLNTTAYAEDYQIYWEQLHEALLKESLIKEIVFYCLRFISYLCFGILYCQLFFVIQINY